MMDEPSSKRSRFSSDAPSEAEILELVAQRESHRQSRNFAQSDAIREQLRSLGVELYDKEKEWRCNDGRRGKLFTAGPGECPLSDDQIQDRINQREDARRSKDFGMADQIRDDLRRVGVELDDRSNEWRTATGRSGTYTGIPASAKSRRGREVDDGHGRQSLNVAAIRKLVAERERLRAAHDYEAADELRRQLAQLGVELFDSERIWRSTSGQSGVIITGGHEVDCFLSDNEIAARVAQRENARHNKDFGMADQVRDQLRQNGVELLDSQRTWVTTDGRSGNYGGGGGGSAGAAVIPPTPAPLPNLSAAAAVPQQLSSLGGSGVQGLLQALGIDSQTAAQAAQSAEIARQQAMGHRGSQITNSPSSMTLSHASIVALVSGRERCRDNHDWEGADGIRTDLRSHGVDVWDKEKMWRANDGRHGVIVRLN